MALFNETLRWVLIAIFIIASLATIADIGKPREPITPRMAITSVIIAAIVVYALLARP